MRTVWGNMAPRHWLSLPFIAAALFLQVPQGMTQCPIFTGTESYAALPATLSTPHWFQCIGSVTADPAPFGFSLTAQPANHSGTVVDWGDGSAPEVVGNWDGATAIPHTYSPDKWQTYTITVTTNACPAGATGILVYEPENPGAVLVYGDNNAGCAPFEAFPKVDVNLAFSPTWSFSLDWGDGTAPDAFSMEDVLTQPEYDTLKFTSSVGDEIYRILGTSHIYDAQNCASGACDHTLTLTYSNYCSVRGANTPYVPGGTIVGTGYKQATLGNAFLTWDIDEAEIEVADPVICWPDNQTTVSNGSCPNCCAASEGNNLSGNGTVRTEKWDFGAATYIGSGPDPTNWIDWGSDCASEQDHLLSFPGPGLYTVRLFTANHCGIDTVTREIMVTPPPEVQATAAITTLCPGDPFQFSSVSWSADAPLTAGDLSFNFTYGDGPYSMTIPLVGGIIPISGIPSQPGHVYDAAGTYNAMVQVFATLAPSCMGNAAIPVTVLTPPTAAFTLPADTCAAALTFQPSDASVDAIGYTWSLDGTGTIGTGPTPPTVQVNGPGAFTMELEVTSANGCSDSFSESIVLAGIPSAAFTADDACFGSPVALDGSSSSTDASEGGPITAFNWSVDGTPLTGETAEFTAATVGSVDVTLTVTTATGCTDSVSGTVEVLPKPSLVFASSDTVGCSPFTVPLSASDTTGTVPENQLVWNFGHGSGTQPDADGTHTWPNNTGNDTLHYTVLVEAGAGLCSDAETITVSVAPEPFVQTLGGEICSGQPFTFQGNSFNLGANGTWFWEVDNVWSTAAQDYGTITSTFEDFNYTLVNPDQVTDTVSITVDVFRSNGCSASSSTALLVRPAFTPNVEDAAGCSPLAVATPNQVALSMTWDFGDVNNPDPPGATAHLYTDPGQYTVSASGTSVFGCAGSAQSTVTVHPTPVPSIAAEDVLCAPEPVNPTRSDAGEDGAANWWLQVDLNTTFPWNGSPDTTLQLNPGTHLLTVVATNSEGCSAEASTTVMVQEAVSASFSLPEGGCEPIPFAVNGVDISSGAIATWIVDTPFGTDTLTGNAPNAPNWIATPGNPGMPGTTATYTVHLSVENPLTGCSASTSDSIAVQPQPVGQMVIDGLAGCDVQATFSYTGVADTLIWDFGDPFAPETEWTTANTITHGYPNPLGTGYQTVASVTAISAGCADQDAVTLDIPSIPVAEMVLPDTLCMGTYFNLNNLSTGVPLALGTASGAWTWTLAGDTLVGFEPSAPPAGPALLGTDPTSNALLEVTLQVVHPENGCSDQTSASIVVLGQPEASFMLTRTSFTNRPLPPT